MKKINKNNPIINEVSYLINSLWPGTKRPMDRQQSTDQGTIENSNVWRGKAAWGDLMGSGVRLCTYTSTQTDTVSHINVSV